MIYLVHVDYEVHSYANPSIAIKRWMDALKYSPWCKSWLEVIYPRKESPE